MQTTSAPQTHDSSVPAGVLKARATTEYVRLTNLRLRIRWALADCRIHRRYMREDAAHGRGVMLKSERSAAYWLREDQLGLVSLRHERYTKRVAA
jgi:hypothetical protein